MHKIFLIFFIFLSYLYSEPIEHPEQWVNLLEPAYRTEYYATSKLKPEGLYLLCDQNTTSVFGALQVEFPFNFVCKFNNPVQLLEMHMDIPDIPKISKPTQIELLAGKDFTNADLHPLGKFSVDRKKEHQKFVCSAKNALFFVVRILDSTDHHTFHIGEIEIRGIYHKEKELYKFPKKVHATITQLETLCKIFELESFVTKDEKGIFTDLQDDKLDDYLLDEVALIASGIETRELCRPYLKKMQKILKEVQNLKLSPYRCAEKIFEILQRDYLKKYRYDEEKLENILLEKEYNCVTASIFYNLLCLRMGLKISAIEVFGHTFSMLRVKNQHWDIELTSPLGFAPKNQKVINKLLIDQPRYIPKFSSKSRSEWTVLEQIALLYYNHAVLLSQEGDIPAFCLTLYKALIINSRFTNALQVFIKTMVKYSQNCCKQKQFSKACQVVESLFSLLPNDKQLQKDYESIYSQWLQVLQEEENEEEIIQLQKKIKQNKKLSTSFKKRISK